MTGGSGSLANEFDFAGQQTDGTGLQYLRARYYDPETGTFLSREPMAVHHSWTHSHHGYANARPTSMVDPSGTVAIDTEGCEGGNVGCHERAGGYMGCTWTTPQSCDLAAGIYPRGFDEVGAWLREYQGKWQYCHAEDIAGTESYVKNPDCDFITGEDVVVINPGPATWACVQDADCSFAVAEGIVVVAVILDPPTSAPMILVLVGGEAWGILTWWVQR